MRKLIEKWKWEKLKWTGSKQEEPIGKNQEKRKKKIGEERNQEPYLSQKKKRERNQEP